MKTIVSDKFEQFAYETNNITFGQLILNKELYTGQKLILGQGLSISETTEIKDIAKCNGIELINLPIAADCNITHKHKIENSIISTPVKINDDEYESDLCIDDDSELLLDHQTGLHMQGMVLVEACRQMFVAVAIDYFSEHYFDDHRYGAINNMDIKFENFAFPLPAKLIYTRLQTIKNKEKDCVGFKAIITIQQAERTAMTMELQHTYYRAEKINSVEQYKSKSACKRLIDSLDKTEETVCA